MPTYEYECGKCKKRFEIFQSMKAAPLKTCSECGGSLRRLIGSGAGIIFKGKGFYATDYRKGKKSESPACPDSKNNASCDSCPRKKTS